MPKDNFRNAVDSLTAPSRSCFAVMPHDGDALQSVTKSIYVGLGGDVTLRAVDDDSDVTFTGVPDGCFLDIRVTHIRATGTSASNMVGLS